MSKDIWHTADELPDFDKSYVELSRSLQGDLVYSTWGHPNYITPNTIKWCYLDDLLALETELERTKKQLEIAVDTLNYIRRTNPISFHFEAIEKALEQITALEQKE